MRSDRLDFLEARYDIDGTIFLISAISWSLLPVNDNGVMYSIRMIAGPMGIAVTESSEFLGQRKTDNINYLFSGIGATAFQH